MELTLDRAWKKASYTVGRLYVDGVFFSNTMEDRDRGLYAGMTEKELGELKVYGQTAIPTGRYKVVLTFSSKFCTRAWAKFTDGRVPEIKDVPGFVGVRIHPLNCAEDSLGCIGPGKNDKVGWVSQSTDYYTRLLKEHLLPAWKRGDEVYLTIR